MVAILCRPSLIVLSSAGGCMWHVISAHYSAGGTTGAPSLLALMSQSALLTFPFIVIYRSVYFNFDNTSITDTVLIA